MSKKVNELFSCHFDLEPESFKILFGQNHKAGQIKSLKAMLDLSWMDLD